MKKLPTEVIVQIASHLSISDKLNLACAWKKLHIITESVLYSTLVFKNIIQFNQAMELCQRKDIGHLVLNLHIEMVDYNSEFVVALPGVFSRVQQLDWGPNELTQQYDPPAINFNTSVFRVFVKNWMHMESIVDHSRHLNLSTHLLETAVCKQLTSIDISFYQDRSARSISHRKMKTLIASIHNGPALERIVFKEVPITLADMENLHRGAQNLKSVKMQDVCIYKEHPRALVGLHPVESITSFSLMVTNIENSGEEEGGETLANALNAWISYNGSRYIHLSYLELCIDQSNLAAIDEEDLTSTFLANALGNLKHLSSYCVNLIAPCQSVLNVLDTNEIRLKHLMIYFEEKEHQPPFEETINAVMAAPSTSILSSLSVECKQISNSLDISRIFIPLAPSLKHLTHLKVDHDYSVYIVILFVDILQNLTGLESLDFGLLYLGMDDTAMTNPEEANDFCSEQFEIELTNV